MQLFKKCWYEVCKQKLVIWEGVCAFWNPSDCQVTLVKLNQAEEAVILPLGCWPNIITSEGYWLCAELCGRFSNGTQFVYHSRCPTEAVRLLNDVSLLIGAKLQALTVRLDPDPLRQNFTFWIEKRLNSWKLLTLKFSLLDFRLILDSDMPL